MQENLMLLTLPTFKTAAVVYSIEVVYKTDYTVKLGYNEHSQIKIYYIN